MLLVECPTCFVQVAADRLTDHLTWHRALEAALLGEPVTPRRPAWSDVVRPVPPEEEPDEDEPDEPDEEEPQAPADPLGPADTAPARPDRPTGPGTVNGDERNDRG